MYYLCIGGVVVFPPSRRGVREEELVGLLPLHRDLPPQDFALFVYYWLIIS